MNVKRDLSPRTLLTAIGSEAIAWAGEPSSTTADGHEIIDFDHETTAHRERLALAVQTRDELGLENGDQVRIECGDCNGGTEDGIATIGVGLAERRGDVVGFEEATAERLAFIDDGGSMDDIVGAAASIEPYGPHPEYETRQDALDHTEYVEVLEDDGTAAELAVTAPHGTYLEYNTEKQADRVYERTTAEAVEWTCVGYSDELGAFDRWHIMSADISPRSFPELDRIADRGFDHAVSFHGFSGWDCFDEDIVIGGGAPEQLKRDLEAEIESRTEFAVLVTGIDGDEATDHDCEQEPFPGTSTANFVNWLTADDSSGLQVEQSPAVREDGNWEVIADAVVDVYERTI
ncbi:poly-gamma-glutamate hydrolase family protein [Natrialba taiwanensis]|uniref:Uncharacterized protein n=1 Tax=Natrialba taiwanensis DSM 12281 TaxID=1230458 RepID=L9ZMA5_9EURY|nr:poly-gamma-glutamate hydrolase family protein [Natrialba taiwanensis]ELY87484.1 hypothetical protein C484_17371 [Natrialba taiwanensis DSM 12281]